MLRRIEIGVVEKNSGVDRDRALDLRRLGRTYHMIDPIFTFRIYSSSPYGTAVFDEYVWEDVDPLEHITVD